jgi:hypothetical protein
MKTIRADLSNEGRIDILEKTMPYRGGQCVHLCSTRQTSDVYGRIFSRGMLAR